MSIKVNHLINRVPHTESILNISPPFWALIHHMSAHLWKLKGKLLWDGGMVGANTTHLFVARCNWGYRFCKDPDFRKHFGKEYQWLCDCGGWDVTLCHLSRVSIYPGFDSFLSEKFHFCVYPIYAWKTFVDMFSVMSPRKISILLRLLKYYHLLIEFVDNFCSHGDFWISMNACCGV